VGPVAFLALFFAWPLIAILDEGLRPDGTWGLDALGDLWGSPRQRGILWFTAWQAGLSTLLTLVVGLPGAWAFSRLSWRGRELAWALLLVPFVLPTVVVGAAMVELADVGGVEVRGARWGIVAAHVFFNVAVVIRTVGLAWRRLDPRLEEAAAVLGGSRRRVATRITLPLLAPSIVAAASLVYLFTFTSFGVVLVLGASQVRTIEVEIYERTRSLDLAGGAALALVQLVVVVGLVAVAAGVQRRWSRALPVRDERRTAHRPRGGERLALAAILAGLAALLAAPPLALVARSLRTAEGWGLTYYRTLGESRRGSVLFVSPLDAVWASLRTAAAATALALLVGGLAAVGLVVAERRHERRVAARGGIPGRRPRAASAVDALLMLPLGTSAVTIGFGFVVGLREPPLDLRGSAWLVPIAQALVAVPFVVRTLLPALRSVDPHLRAAARTLGASPARAWREVDLPLVLRPLAGAAAFALAISLGEFGATVFVASARTPTLPIVVERLLGQPGELNAGQAMAAATILMVLTTAVVAAVELPRRWRRA
jgi:thiamine transport system permease protein